jgi:hypothetical protein
MTIYLYVKTHRVTGLKYLGKTVAKDPYKYPGSGIYWKAHLKKHGDDVHTEILHECKDNNELRDLGIYYSELWNVVDAVDENGRKIWANVRPEEGTGGWGGDQNPNNLPHVKELARKRATTNNPIHLPGIKEKSRKNTKKAMWDPAIRERYLAGINSEKWRNARAKRVGNKAPCFDHTVYKWAHKDGIVVECTQYDLRQLGDRINTGELIKGGLKTSKGWRLVK